MLIYLFLAVVVYLRVISRYRDRGNQWLCLMESLLFLIISLNRCHTILIRQLMVLLSLLLLVELKKSLPSF